MKKGLLLISLCTLVSCGVLEDRSRAVKVMAEEGYTNINVFDQSFVALSSIAGCATDDTVAFAVEAKNPLGETVYAWVCCGDARKRCTIRVVSNDYA
jgi:hypothetical protein